MKIGIITFHKSYNYGSVLQTYALQTYLQTLGNEVKIIDFIYTKDFNQYKLFRTQLYFQHPKVFIRDIKRLRKNIKRKNSFERFEKSSLYLTPHSYTEKDNMRNLNQDFDCFICGSDQIWNLSCTNGVVPPFFLDFAEVEKKCIAYAPSIAHTSFSSNEKDIADYLKKFLAISVREKSTVSLVQKYTDKKVIPTVDPTLLLKRENYHVIEKSVPVNTKYMFFYQLEKNTEMVKWCINFAKDKSLKVLYINKDTIAGFDNSKNCFGISPGEFLFLIHNAEYVVTNSFHATVFSILYGKKFVTFKTINSSARMIDLLDDLGLKGRLHSINIEENIDYENVWKKLDAICLESEEFLKEALVYE